LNDNIKVDRINLIFESRNELECTGDSGNICCCGDERVTEERECLCAVTQSDASASSTPQAFQQRGMLRITICEAVPLPLLSKLGIWLRHKQGKQNRWKEVVHL
jgi:hypothetical protein